MSAFLIPELARLQQENDDLKAENARLAEALTLIADHPGISHLSVVGMMCERFAAVQAIARDALEEAQ